MRLFYIIFLLLCLTNSVCATRSETDSILHVLRSILNHKKEYELEKEKQIGKLLKQLDASDLNDNRRYTIHKQLYDEYYPYRIDSAICYLEKNLQIAYQLNNTEYIYETKPALALMYWQMGHFFESLSILESLDRNMFDALPSSLLYYYYESYKRLYRYYAESQPNKINEYYQRSNLYRDSLMHIVEQGSLAAKVLAAEKLTDENKTDKAKQILLDLIALSTEENHERAILTNILGNIYKKEGNVEQQKKYYAMSSICDIKNAVKENASMHALALLLYKEGDIDNAYRYIQSSLEDALFCNTHFRRYEITQIFPIIDSAYQTKAGKQKRELKFYLLLVSILLTFLVVALIYVYRQMKRIAKIRKELYHANLQLQELNADLHNSNIQLHHLNNELIHVNQKLSETNMVKEIYLGKFIDLCSSYIEKLDSYRRSLNRIAIHGKIEDLYAALKSNKYINSELHTFYRNFDETFLRIYPTFIDDFNALFPDDERQTPKAGELFNTELRIFALIRLGINDSTQIALFLRYSLTTVYTYRSRLKNKSLYKNNLEEHVMKIGKYS